MKLTQNDGCIYKNHSPKYSYLESIQTFKNRDDLPDELYNLDILDGSYAVFSIAEIDKKDWGKKKKVSRRAARTNTRYIIFLILLI